VFKNPKEISTENIARLNHVCAITLAKDAAEV